MEQSKPLKPVMQLHVKSMGLGGGRGGGEGGGGGGGGLGGGEGGRGGGLGMGGMSYDPVPATTLTIVESAPPSVAAIPYAMLPTAVVSVLGSAACSVATRTAREAVFAGSAQNVTE